MIILRLDNNLALDKFLPEGFHASVGSEIFVFFALFAFLVFFAFFVLLAFFPFFPFFSSLRMSVWSSFLIISSAWRWTSSQTSGRFWFLIISASYGRQLAEGSVRHAHVSFSSALFLLTSARNSDCFIFQPSASASSFALGSFFLSFSGFSSTLSLFGSSGKNKNRVPPSSSSGISGNAPSFSLPLTIQSRMLIWIFSIIWGPSVSRTCS